MRGVLSKARSAVRRPPPHIPPHYRLTFFDEFDTRDISPSGPPSTKWTDHRFWEPSHAAKITVSNSVCTLLTDASISWDAVGLSSLAHEDPKTAAGAYWTYGYFEARLKWTEHKGSWPGFWLFSRNNPYRTDPGLTPEIDIVEAQGNKPHYYYTTLHRDTSGDDITNGDVMGWSNVEHNTGVSLAEWHTYGVMWNSVRVIFYFDNEEVSRCPIFEGSTTQPMFLMFNIDVGGNWFGDNRPDGTPLKLEIDWVRVWQE